MNNIKSINLPIIIAFSLLILKSNVNAQTSFMPGYIIQIAGDTVRGEIKVNEKKDLGLYSRVTFKEGNQAPKTYKANKIKGYFVDGYSFFSRNIDGEQMFIRLLSKGNVNLYDSKMEVLQMNEVKEKIDYYVEKPGEEGPVRIKSMKFRKQVAEYMSDNAEIVQALEDKKYDYDNIVEVFNAYNNVEAED